MKASEYLEDSSRTAAMNIESIMERLFNTNLAYDNEKKSPLVYPLLETKVIGKKIDSIKKYLFYGKKIKSHDLARILFAGVYFNAICPSKKRLQNSKNKEAFIALFHMLLGIVSEAGEISERLIQIVKQDYEFREEDIVNLIEEIGDIEWYQAMGLRALGTDYETAWAKNIEKLKTRFPDKFTEERAINRDVDKEYEVLKR